MDPDNLPSHTRPRSPFVAEGDLVTPLDVGGVSSSGNLMTVSSIFNEALGALDVPQQSRRQRWVRRHHV